MPKLPTNNSAIKLVITCCAGCPFVRGMGGGDVMPSFVQCTVGGFRANYGYLPETNLFDIGLDPPPPDCPLRANPGKIVIEPGV